MKKNNFAEETNRYMEIKAKFRKGNEAHDEYLMEEAKSDMNHFLEDMVKKNGEDYCTMFRNYHEAYEKGNEYIDIDENGWYEKDPEKMLEMFRKFGIEKFTFSSTWSSAVERAFEYVKNGCKVDGMVEVNDQWDPIPGCYAKKPAYLFSVE